MRLSIAFDGKRHRERESLGSVTVSLERHDRTEEVNVITVGLSSCTDDDLGTRHVIETVSDVSRGGNDCPNDAPPKVDPLSA